ncbi:MAG: CoA pyrophosphatase [Bacteroidales bacterium]|nr:CoA pyrophosphatase [Bacteroidales bacterium]
MIKKTLIEAFNAGLPGEKVQWEMASSDRLIRNFPRTPRSDSAEAAVMILLYRLNGSLNTVFIKRPDYEGIHGGQISFPGGKREKSDRSAEETALRETAEETGLPVKNISIIGQLTPLYIHVSNINVIPFAGWFEGIPVFRPQKSEVDFLIEAGLESFIREPVIKTGSFKVRGENIDIKYFDYMGHVIWGATAMIFNEFLEIIRRTGLKVRE